MSKKSQVIPEKIHLVSCTIASASLKSDFQVPEDHIENHSLMLGYDTSYNIDEDMVKAEIKVDVAALQGKKEVGEGHFELIFIYHVENLKELTQVDGDQLTVNGGLSNALASITYSTTRGILITRFQGTLLKNFTLPVINPNDLLEK